MRRRRQWLGPVNDVGTNLKYLHPEHHGNIWFLVSFRPSFSYADELVRRPGTILSLDEQREVVLGEDLRDAGKVALSASSPSGAIGEA